MQYLSRWCAVLTVVIAGAAWAEPIPAITKASDDVTLSYARNGRVAKILVKEGDTVKADQALVELDAREEAAQLAIDEAKAADQTRVTAQDAILEQKKVDLRKTQWAFDHGAKSEFELDAAKIDVVVADAQLKIAKVEHEQDQLKAGQTRAVVDKMTLRSPVDGSVAQSLVKEGEGVEPNTKVIRVVNIQPLEIEVPVPFDQARQLQKDGSVQIIFSDKTTGDGKIKSVGEVADSASNTVLVRVSVPNPGRRPGGERVQVDFTPGKVAAP
jgi:HlyD family secretion protein